MPSRSRRSSESFCAHGCTAPGWSAAMFPTYPGFNGTAHRPDKSGLPFAVLGVGAVRFGLPSGRLGMPVVGCFSHCASSEVADAAAAARKAATRRSDKAASDGWLRMANYSQRPRVVLSFWERSKIVGLSRRANRLRSRTRQRARGPGSAGAGVIVFRQHSEHDVLVDVDPERLRDDQRNSRAAEPRIA